MGYFVAGWALHRVVLSRRWTIAAVVVGVLALAEIIWQYGHPDRFPVLHQLFPVARWGSAVAVASVCVFLVAVQLGRRYTPPAAVVQVLKRLSDASFGVFLIHLLIFELIREVAPAVVAADSLGVLTVAYLVVLVGSFAVSIGASRIPLVRAVF